VRQLVLFLLPRRVLRVVAAERIALRGGNVVHGGWYNALDGRSSGADPGENLFLAVGRSRRWWCYGHHLLLEGIVEVKLPTFLPPTPGETLDLLIG
jgi:hypothetical protein